MELVLSLTTLEGLHFPASTGTPGSSSVTYSCIRTYTPENDGLLSTFLVHRSEHSSKPLFISSLYSCTNKKKIPHLIQELQVKLSLFGHQESSFYDRYSSIAFVVTVMSLSVIKVNRKPPLPPATHTPTHTHIHTERTPPTPSAVITVRSSFQGSCQTR